jgi:hypothetical protein
MISYDSLTPRQTNEDTAPPSESQFCASKRAVGPIVTLSAVCWGASNYQDRGVMSDVETSFGEESNFQAMITICQPLWELSRSRSPLCRFPFARYWEPTVPINFPVPKHVTGRTQSSVTKPRLPEHRQRQKIRPGPKDGPRRIMLGGLAHRPIPERGCFPPTESSPL